MNLIVDGNVHLGVGTTDNMSEEPRLSAVDVVIKGLKKSKRQLHQLLNMLPDEDAYATPYSNIVDGINNIDNLIKELKPSLKEAKKYRKQNPDQFPNRAKKWCPINDSRRK